MFHGQNKESIELPTCAGLYSYAKPMHIVMLKCISLWSQIEPLILWC